MIQEQGRGSWALPLAMSSSPSLNYEACRMAVSLITMTDWPSVGISQTVIVVCTGDERKRGRSLFSIGSGLSLPLSRSLSLPFFFLHENSRILSCDWLREGKRCCMVWRGRSGAKPETGDVALMVLCSLLSPWHRSLKITLLPHCRVKSMLIYIH